MKDFVEMVFTGADLVYHEARRFLEGIKERNLSSEYATVKVYWDGSAEVFTVNHLWKLARAAVKLALESPRTEICLFGNGFTCVLYKKIEDIKEHVSSGGYWIINTFGYYSAEIAATVLVAEWLTQLNGLPEDEGYGIIKDAWERVFGPV